MRKKIMVVDDDPKIVKALELRLSSAGYDIISTFNGITALMLAKNNPPDLIISDVWMPAGTGLSLAYRMREIMPGLPIIFLTASKQPGLEEKARGLGGAAFLEKPYEPEVLLKMVSDLLGDGGATQQEPPALAVNH
jgi:two-component system, OmpR family, response regulator